MPNRNHGGQSGESMQGARDVGQRLREGVGRMGEQMRDQYESAREGAMHGYRQAEGLVARNPGTSVLVGFGVGFGLGVLLTVLLTQEEEPWHERQLRRLRDLDLTGRFRDLHLADRLRDIPEAVSKRLS